MPSSTRGSSVPSARERVRERVRATSRVAGVDLDDVLTGPRLELVGGAGGDHAAVVDDDDLLGELVGLVEVLRRQQHVGAGVDEVADRVPELDAAAGIEAGRRFVEQQQLGRADEARAEVELAAHAARVGLHPAIRAVDQPEPFEHGRRRWRARPRARCPKRRAIISRFSRPVIVGSTAAY